MKMYEYKYTLLEGIWGISITIFGEVCDKKDILDEVIAVREGIYLSFSSKPLRLNEIFCKEDRTAIYKAVDMLADYIKINSLLGNNTVIKICSLQYDVCYYQEEGMLIAMLYWCAKTFHFELQGIKSHFDHMKNRYIFDLNGMVIKKLDIC
ncbi:MAG: hypothetical protein NC251_08120 [Lachnoclostridium sp.]|nr:hypothetical protein [Lachnospira sp.]MCM1248379.1 hypothetical protein [Lachnoclostridium sp.]